METTRDEVLKKFNELLDETIERGNNKEMQLTRCMFNQAVEFLTDLDMDLSKEFVERFEGVLNYNNFLTEGESRRILLSFLNQDGSKGAHWKDPDLFFKKLQSCGKELEERPYYNKWALYVTANMYSSDHHNDIIKWVGGDLDKYFEACVDFSYSQLTDKDRPEWVRWYFHIN